MQQRTADIWNQTVIETKVFFRQKMLMFWSFIFPLIFLFIFSVDRSSLDFMFPGMVVVALLTTCVTNTVPIVVNERRWKLYKRLQVTPLRRSTLIAAKLINRYMVVVIQMVIMFVVAGLAFGIWPQGSLLELAFLITLGAMCLLSVAFLIAGIVQDEHAATIVAMIVFFTLAFGSNTFFSTDLYPAEVEAAVWVLPTTHLATRMREIMQGQSVLQDAFSSFLWMTGYWLLFGVLSIKLFRWGED